MFINGKVRITLTVKLKWPVGEIKHRAASQVFLSFSIATLRSTDTPCNPNTYFQIIFNLVYLVFVFFFGPMNPAQSTSVGRKFGKRCSSLGKIM